MKLVEVLLQTTARALATLRRRVRNVRYGPPGTILYDVDAITYATTEPKDVCPVGFGDTDFALRWALARHLEGKSRPFTNANKGHQRPLAK